MRPAFFRGMNESSQRLELKKFTSILTTQAKGVKIISSNGLKSLEQLGTSLKEETKIFQ